MTTGVQGREGCPWGCPNDCYEACERNGSREQCNDVCCPDHLKPEGIIRPDGSLRSQWEMDGGLRMARGENIKEGNIGVPVRATRGPWRVGGHGGLAVEDAQGHTLASLGYGSRLKVSGAVPVGENIGNARLMAAAPELLAVVQELVSGSINPYESSLSSSEAHYTVAYTLMERAREALRVAEGR